MNFKTNNIYIWVKSLALIYSVLLNCSDHHKDTIELEKLINQKTSDYYLSNEEFKELYDKQKTYFKKEEEFINFIYKKTDKVYIESLKPSIVKIFLDSSGSMYGYFHDRTIFEDNLGNLFIKMLKYHDENLIKFFSPNNLKSEFLVNDKKDFFFNLTPGVGIFQSPSRSNLNELFDNILNSTSFKNKEIAIFVSDLLYDVGTPDLTKELTKYESFIENSFSLKQKSENFDIFLLRYYVPFNGIYKQAKGKTINLNHPRPVFVIFLGEPLVLRNFLNSIDFNDQKNLENLLYITKLKLNDFIEGKLLKYTKKGNFYIEEENNHKTIIKFSSSKKELSFYYVLRFKNLNFLSNSIMLNKSFYKIEPKELESNFTPKLFDKNQIYEADWKLLLKSIPYNYIYEFSFQENIPKKIKFFFSLNNPNWIEQYYTDDDTEIQTQLEKTFSLKQFINAILKNFSEKEKQESNFYHTFQIID